MKPKLTIVGPEATDPEGRSLQPGSIRTVHLEALFLMAKYDAAFRQDLLEKRMLTLNSSAIPFSDHEKKLLNSMSSATLDRTIENFFIDGISRSSLPEWHKAASVLLLVSTVIFGSAGCSLVRPALAGSIMEHPQKKEGWQDQEAYRVLAIGQPRKGVTNRVAQKAYAKEAAILMARKKIKEHFYGYRIARLQGAGAMSGVDISAAESMKIQGIINGGSVVRIEYNEENVCEIVYEVRYPGLKKLILQQD